MRRKDRGRQVGYTKLNEKDWAVIMAVRFGGVKPAGRDLIPFEWRVGTEDVTAHVKKLWRAGWLIPTAYLAMEDGRAQALGVRVNEDCW